MAFQENAYHILNWYVKLVYSGSGRGKTKSGTAYFALIVFTSLQRFLIVELIGKCSLDVDGMSSCCRLKLQPVYGGLQHCFEDRGTAEKMKVLTLPTCSKSASTQCCPCFWSRDHTLNSKGFPVYP